MKNNIKNILEKLIPIVQPILEKYDPAHDYSHCLRVLKNSMKINSVENGDAEILAAASMLHDICNYPKNHPLASQSSTLSSKKAEEILIKIEFDKNKIPAVKDAVICHSFSANKTPQTLEGKIFQDADRLDGIGAIGIARTFATSATMKSKMYSIDDPFGENRILNDKLYAVDHFYIKLFKLADKMQTKTGKKLAIERTKYMKNFLETLEKEI